MSDFLPGVSFGLPPAGGPRLSVCLCFYPVRRWDTCPRGKPACSQGKPSRFFYCPARDSRKPSAANRHQLRCGERTRWRVLWILALTDVLVGEQRFALANNGSPWRTGSRPRVKPQRTCWGRLRRDMLSCESRRMCRFPLTTHERSRRIIKRILEECRTTLTGLRLQGLILIAPRHRDRTVIL